jgi:hypothetical protein
MRAARSIPIPPADKRPVHYVDERCMGAVSPGRAAHNAIPVTTARFVTRRLVEKLGIAATRAAIAALSVDHSLQPWVELEAELDVQPDPNPWGGGVTTTVMSWQQVIEGSGIAVRPIDRIAAGASVDLIFGTSTDEQGSLRQQSSRPATSWSRQTPVRRLRRVDRGSRLLRCSGGGRRAAPTAARPARSRPARPRASVPHTRCG